MDSGMQGGPTGSWRAGAGHGGRPCAGGVRPVADDGAMIGDRWGVSDSEVLRAYPCDDLVAAPVLRAWRGIRIEAPAGAVWPWVAQIRLAPYSYDWIDNRG